MEDMKSIGDRTVVELVGSAMSLLLFSVNPK